AMPRPRFNEVPPRPKLRQDGLSVGLGIVGAASDGARRSASALRVIPVPRLGCKLSPSLSLWAATVADGAGAKGSREGAPIAESARRSTHWRQGRGAEQ